MGKWWGILVLSGSSAVGRHSHQVVILQLQSGDPGSSSVFQFNQHLLLIYLFPFQLQLGIGGGQTVLLDKMSTKERGEDVCGSLPPHVRLRRDPTVCIQSRRVLLQLLYFMF